MKSLRSTNSALRQKLLAAGIETNRIESIQGAKILQAFYKLDPVIIRLHPATERPWECDKCDHAAKTEIKLAKHKSAVHAVKKFSCQLCPLKFAQQARLNNHLRDGHKLIVLNPNERRCTINNSGRKYSLLMEAFHLCKCHPEMLSLTCPNPDCPRKFAKAQQRNNHKSTAKCAIFY